MKGLDHCSTAALTPISTRSLAQGQVSASNLAQEHEEIIEDLVVPWMWLAAIATIIVLCVVQFA